MTCREKLKREHPDKIDPNTIAGCVGCPDDYDYIDPPGFCACNENDCNRCWDREIPEEVEKASDEPRIKDSGDRTQFASGAVRDMREGKGRCDLMPLGVIAGLTSNHVLKNIYLFQFHNDTIRLEMALKEFILNYTEWCPDGYYESQGVATMALEVAKHFEEGAKKYGENNWQKGIPTHCYIDSAVRHYLKWLRGDKDEPHDRAFCWNILCCIWTCEHMPELNNYGKKE